MATPTACTAPTEASCPLPVPGTPEMASALLVTNSSVAAGKTSSAGGTTTASPIAPMPAKSAASASSSISRGASVRVSSEAFSSAVAVFTRRFGWVTPALTPAFALVSAFEPALVLLLVPGETGVVGTTGFTGCVGRSSSLGSIGVGSAGIGVHCA